MMLIEWIIGGVAFIAFIFYQIADRLNDERQEYKRLLEEELGKTKKCCYNCEHMNKFKPSYNEMECYCKDGSSHSKFDYSCKNFDFNNEVTEEAEYRVKFRLRGR